MLLVIGLGLISGVFIGRKILKNHINQKNLNKYNFNGHNSNENYSNENSDKQLTEELSQKLSIVYSKAINDYKSFIKQSLKKAINFIDSVPYVVYKRIHSLTGIFFLGGFVIVHFLNNSLAYDPKKLNQLSSSIHKMPFFPLIEILGIYLPLSVHTTIGLILLRKGKIDTRIKTETNYRYILQRISAYFILKTLLFHLVTIRFNEYIPSSIRKLFNIPSSRDLAYEKVNIWFRPPLSIIGYINYTLLITSVAYHLSNGIWTSAITWGLAQTYEKQVKLRKFSNIVFVVLVLWGKYIIYLYSKEKQNSYEEKSSML